jgi:hypothetical protein
MYEGCEANIDAAGTDVVVSFVVGRLNFGGFTDEQGQCSLVLLTVQKEVTWIMDSA